MACVENIEDSARCGDVIGKIEKTAISEVSAIIAVVISIAEGIKKVIDLGSDLFNSVGVQGISVIIGAIAAVTTIIFFIVNKNKQCNEVAGSLECIEGVVVAVYPSLNNSIDKLLPFIATHTRIDVLVKRKYWAIIESGSAKVFCDDLVNLTRTERSAIIRCYEKNDVICNAADGALIGAIIGAVAGTALGSLINPGLVGCLNIILCLLLLVVSALVAIIGAIAGATIGSHTAIGSTDSIIPRDQNGWGISVGSAIRIKGNMIRREEDEGANALWWITESIKELGNIMPNSDSSRPRYSYCDLEDKWPDDMFNDNDIC